MGIRTDDQLDTILKNSQINMFDSLMDISYSLTEYISPEIVNIEDSWIKQVVLIHLLDSRFSTNTQRQKAADELARLDFNKAKYSGYWSFNYSYINYAQ
jgi:hypothetical protein